MRKCIQISMFLDLKNSLFYVTDVDHHSQLIMTISTSFKECSQISFPGFWARPDINNITSSLKEGNRSNPERYIGGLKKNGRHRLVRSGTIRRCGLAGVVWLCWRKCHLGVGFEVSDAEARAGVSLSSCYLQIQIQDFQLPPHHHVCLHAALFSARMKMD